MSNASACFMAVLTVNVQTGQQHAQHTPCTTRWQCLHTNGTALLGILCDNAFAAFKGLERSSISLTHSFSSIHHHVLTCAMKQPSQCPHKIFIQETFALPRVINLIIRLFRVPFIQIMQTMFLYVQNNFI